LNSGRNLNPDFIDDLLPQDFSEDIRLISVNDIISFFTDPGKYMMTNVIGISDRVFQNEVEDRELFDLRGLDRYQVDALLYDSLQLQMNIEPMKVLNYLKATGMIPDKLKGKKDFEQEYSNTKELLDEIRGLTSGAENEAEISFNVSDFEIYGEIKGIYENSLVLHRIGERRAVHEIRLWILHNVLLASDYPINNSYYISVDKKENKVETLKLDSSSIDVSVFEDLLDWYLTDKPMSGKLNFFPETSKKFVTQLLKNNTEKIALAKAHTKYFGGYNSSYAEGSQYFNKLMWRGKDPTTFQAFKDNANRFWVPFFKAVEDSK
jgi:exodeoxyribonuclease V gamma subunit